MGSPTGQFNVKTPWFYNIKLLLLSYLLTTTMAQNQFTIGFPENGQVTSHTTRIQPPGGVSHFDNQDMLPQSASIKQGNRILKPPGGMSSNIFSETESVTSSNESRASSTSPKTPQKVYKMASNFELGDEQPENPIPRRKPFKPSVNPLTGELIGCPGVVVPTADEKKPVVRSATRVPPGGYSTPLW